VYSFKYVANAKKTIHSGHQKLLEDIFETRSGVKLFLL